jgi:hypothetical protein
VNGLLYDLKIKVLTTTDLCDLYNFRVGDSAGVLSLVPGEKLDEECTA